MAAVGSTAAGAAAGKAVYIGQHRPEEVGPREIILPYCHRQMGGALAACGGRVDHTLGQVEHLSLPHGDGLAHERSVGFGRGVVAAAARCTLVQLEQHRLQASADV
jgi:hypothetical protein